MWANFRLYTHGEKLMNIEPSVHSKAHTDKLYQYGQCGNNFYKITVLKDTSVYTMKRNHTNAVSVTRHSH